MLYQPCPENKSLSFHDPSMKHHRPGVANVEVVCTWCPLIGSFITCASAQSDESNYANLSVYLGSISRLLKTLLFWPFHIYHNIHVNWRPSIFGLTLQKRWSILAKRELIGKILGCDGILDNTHTWRAGGHSKNTWFIDSSGSPHRTHISPCIPLDFRF